MTNIYDRFIDCKIDLSPLGVLPCSDDSKYFCTPEGAEVFGRAGVDGIHFCFIQGFGETVFAVSPMNLPGEYVHPLAESFADFLRLLLSCGDSAALEQAWQWSREQFDGFLAENPITDEQRAAIEKIADNFDLRPMEKPFEYIKSVQSVFDYGRIKYTDAMNDALGENDMRPSADVNSVYFEMGFGAARGRACKEIVLQKKFEWAGRQWFLPSVWVCGKGLVVDLYMRVDAEDFRRFADKWGLSEENDRAENFSDEIRMKMESENPLDFDFKTALILNGKKLNMSCSYGRSFIPCISQNIDADARELVIGRGLDTSACWLIRRISFPNTAKRMPKIKSLAISLRQNAVPVPGAHFTAEEGGSARFVCPTDGGEYTLFVRELKQYRLPKEIFGHDDKEYPLCGTSITCSVEPKPPCERISVSDCAVSDPPREKTSANGKKIKSSKAVSVGVIGGADGPVAVFSASGGGKDEITASSALHFEPADSVEWRIVFHEKQFDDFYAELIQL